MKKESRVWIILDVNYLAWRSFHTTGKLSLGVLFGLFRQLKVLTGEFASDQFVFCFDSGVSKRQAIFPGYKQGRRNKERTPEEEDAVNDMRKQLALFQNKYLKRLGFVNVFHARGYEADDVIASVCSNIPSKDEAVIVSADKDLYQLLGDERISLWDPFKREATIKDRVIEQYGIHPGKWVLVKALAGCSTDSIPGCKGVGEKLAAKYFTDGMMPAKTILAASEFHKSPDFDRNIQLVTLPLIGCPGFNPQPQQPIDDKVWNVLMKKLGMSSLHNAAPNYAGFGLSRRR